MQSAMAALIVLMAVMNVDALRIKHICIQPWSRSICHSIKIARCCAGTHRAGAIDHRCTTMFIMDEIGMNTKVINLSKRSLNHLIDHGLFSESPAHETEIELDLLPCQKYIVGVSVLDEKWNVQKPTNWLRIQTAYDKRAAPAKPQSITFGRHIRFTWSHSCLTKGQHPSNYTFKITDLVLNKTEVFVVDGLSYEFRMVMGATYKASVAAPYDRAIPLEWSFAAPLLPAPRNFHVTELGSNSFEFHWDLVKFRDET